MDQLLLKDLKFIQDLSPDLATTVIEMMTINVTEVYNMLQSGAAEATQFLSDINSTRKAESLGFYQSTLEVFTELERYEECMQIMYIIQCLELIEE